MGTILLKTNSGIFEIVDGQQRLITLTLFLFAFRDVYHSLKFNYIENILKNRIILNDKDNVYESIFRKVYNRGQELLTILSQKI